MDVLESLVNAGLIGSSVFCASNGESKIACYCAAVAVAEILLDSTLNYFDRREQARVRSEEARFNFEVMKVRPHLY